MHGEQSGAPVVRATGVRKRFGDIQAVDGVDIAVAAGNGSAFVGPNGAGKTTLLLMLLGAIDPDEGSVASCWDSGCPTGAAPRWRTSASPPGTSPPRPADEALRFFADLHDDPDPTGIVDRVIDELDIGYLHDKSCMSLWSGQATLVGIAKAVMHRPRLVVLDKPTASLDPDIALQVRDALARLNDDHHTALLLAGHDIREVEALTERVVFLRDGHVLADGAPATVVADAGHDTLEEMFLAEAVRMRGARL